MAKHDFYLKVKFMQKVLTFLANAIAVSSTPSDAVTKRYRTTKDLFQNFMCMFCKNYELNYGRDFTVA